MSPANESTRVLRTAAWVWIGFLVAMLIMDGVLFLPGVSTGPNLLPRNLPTAQLQRDIAPVLLYYGISFSVALVFLGFTYWDGLQKLLGTYHSPVILLIIAIAPILVNTFVLPRFPPGQLSNAEGMALRQLPIQLVALALVAWQYKFPHIIVFSVGVSAVNLLFSLPNAAQLNNLSVHVFIAIIRIISFIVAGIFINQLVAQLRAQRESLREANANLTHYASTLEQLTVSRERNRLARELHDTLAHSLTAISVSLETAKAYFDIDSDKSRELMDTSLEATRKGVDDTRRALKALRSSALEDMGLVLAIKREAESAAGRFNLNLTLDLPPSTPSLSPDIEQTIYRIAQEAIQNVCNHAQAKNLSIKLEGNEHTLLTIQDDGIGFDANTQTPTGHFGIVGMRERASLTGGSLTIESTKNNGTKIVLRI